MPKSQITNKSSTYEESEITPRSISLTLTFEDEFTTVEECNFIMLFNGHVILETKWQNGLYLETEALSVNLKDPFYQAAIANKPLFFLLRATGGKGAKDPDPLLNGDNRAGGTLDLFPLILGEEQIFTKISLNFITTGKRTGRSIIVRAKSCGYTDTEKIPLLITTVSAHCLPVAREGTVYICAVGLDGLLDPMVVNFGMSLSTCTATKVVWATASNGGQAANTAFNVPNEDKFVPPDFELRGNSYCNSVYWNSMNRVLVDPITLQERLSSPLLIEVVGVPKIGKMEVRGRYMGFIDAGVLLEPGQNSVSICTKLLYYNEADLLENMRPLLDIPPSSAKVSSARETGIVLDNEGHNTYITIKFDLLDPLMPKAKIAMLFETLGFRPSTCYLAPTEEELYVESPQEDPIFDIRRIRKEGGALAVHRELSNLACRGAVPMNQGIKRTAANRLLLRVRTILKQFSPGDCSYVEWQDTVTYQHAAGRKAVTSSFAPQPPPPRLPTKTAAARCRASGDNRIADIHTETNMKLGPSHPRNLLIKALRCLEESNDSVARNYLFKALSSQTRNRYLLWTFGGQEFDKRMYADRLEAAAAALRIAAKGDVSDGTTNAISWAALHAYHHYNGNFCAAFVAVKKMRKSYELKTEWKQFLRRWTDTSGEEETFWIPSVIASNNPIVIAAAFFLCLRCFKFSEVLLKCVEEECATRGSRLGLITTITPDIYYIRAASFLLRRQYDKAIEMTERGIKRFGPSAIMSQMFATCLSCARGWDGQCEVALKKMDGFGAEECPALLLRAASGVLNIDPLSSLQRAFRAHKLAPSAHSALLISRIYMKLNERSLAKRWANAAVKNEPLLADGWAVLALLAMYETDIDKARVLLRTAKQAGPLNPDIESEIEKLLDKINVEALPSSLMKNVCFCNYY